MRYYRIDITNAKGEPILPKSLGGQPISSLLPDGTTNPAALNVEFDFPIVGYASPEGLGCHMRIWGLGLEEISQATDLSGALISVQAGMTAGLPLANPAQAGLVMTGKVWQSFGNWIDTDQTVELIFMPNPDQGEGPAVVNYPLDWRAGTKLEDAIRTTLQSTLPDKQVTINISPNLVLPNDEKGSYQSLEQFSERVNELSRMIITTPGYLGVDISSSGNDVTVTDHTTPTSGSIAVAFQDLIGQPTWMPKDELGLVGVQIKTVLRADIKFNSVIQLPRTLISNPPDSYPVQRNSLTFTGEYLVKRVHHYGNFRQPDADSWATTFDLIAATSASSSGDVPSGF